MALSIAVGVLVGGRARRLGGQDKTQLLRHDGHTSLEGILNSFELRTPAQNAAFTCAAPTLLLGRFGQDNPCSGHAFINDRVDDMGPIGGLQRLLEWAQQHGADWGMLVACDMPAFSSVLVERLCAAHSPDRAVLLPCASNNKRHYTAALYHTRLLPSLNAYINSNGKAIRGFVSALSTASVAEVEFLGSETKLLHNVNRPQDLARP